MGLEHLGDLRLLEEYSLADRVAVMHAVADAEIRAGREKQAHDVLVALGRRKVQRSHLRAPMTPSRVRIRTMVEQLFRFGTLFHAEYPRSAPRPARRAARPSFAATGGGRSDTA